MSQDSMRHISEEEPFLIKRVSFGDVFFEGLFASYHPVGFIESGPQTKFSKGRKGERGGW